jgi:hypothetical protein
MARAVDLTFAHRVRREDLRDSSPESDSADEDERRAVLEAKLRERFAKTFATDNLDAPPAARLAATPKPAPAPKQDSNEEDTEADEKETTKPAAKPQEPVEEEFEFRLFKSAAPPAKIVLVEQNDDAPPPEGEMVRVRPLSYYIAEPLTAEEKEKIEFAALSGEEVLRRSTQRWWGMEMPWKVTHVSSAGKILRSETSRETMADQVERLTSADGEDGKIKRRRMGKKRRIAMRTKDREAKKKAEAEDKSKMTKEEHLKEKKKRLNRLRKLKRRAKAKEGKGGEDDGSDSGDGSE